MTTEPTAQELRETIARVISPDIWTNVDKAAAAQRHMPFKHESTSPSLVKAAALLALPELAAALLPTAPQPDAGWLESLKAIWVFAQDTIENGHCEGGALGNLYGIRDETDRLIAIARAAGGGE